jgi:hypothetical protein
MANETRVKIKLDLTEDQAGALAQMCKRMCHSHFVELSSRFSKYPDGRLEIDHMMEAEAVLARALRDEGFAPR